MKIVGIDKQAFLAAAQTVSSKLVWKEIEPPTPGSKPTFTGYFDLLGPASGAWYAYKVPVTAGAAPTVALHKPCSHLLAKVVCKALSEAPTGAFIWAEKCKFSKGWATMPNAVVKKLAAAQAKKGLTCVCGSPSTTVTSKPATPATPATVVSPASAEPTVTLLAEPIAGEPVDDGAAGPDSIQKGTYREVMAAVTSLYVLQEVAQSLRSAVQAECAVRYRATGIGAYHDGGLPAAPVAEACKALWPDAYPHVETFLRFKARYEQTLARNLFDYLTLACVGELRHHVSFVWSAGRPCSRSEAYHQALTYDPRTILPVAALGFTRVNWSSAYGGPKWAKIAESAALYFKFRNYPVVFADHVVDLSHNGGIVFDKGYLLNLGHPKSAYMAMLDRKREGSLLHWPGQTLYVEADAWGTVEPILHSILRPRYAYRTDSDAWARYEAWNAEAAEWQSLPREHAGRRAIYLAWKERGAALGFEPGIGPAAMLTRLEGGVSVTAQVKPTASKSKSILPLQWGAGTFYLTVKGKLNEHKSETHAAPATAAKEHYHAPRPGQAIHEPHAA